MTRFVIVLGLLIAAALLPPAVTTLLAVFCLLYFPRFWEAVLVGLFLDALHGAPLLHMFGFQFIYTLALVLALVVLERLKKSVRVYRGDLAI